MKKIRQTRKYNMVSIVKKIKDYFGEDNIYITFCAFKRERLEHHSTFARDNIDKLDMWITMQHAKLFSGSLDIVTVVVRIFLPEKISIDGPKGKIEIPKKDLYHLAFTKDKIILQDESETYENQNTDAFTGEALEHEKGIVYRSSIGLYDLLVPKESNLDFEDEPLEPIIIDLKDLLSGKLPEGLTKSTRKIMGQKIPDPNRFDCGDDDWSDDPLIKEGYRQLNNPSLSIHIHNRFRLLLRRLRRRSPGSKHFLESYRHLEKLIKRVDKNVSTSDYNGKS